MDFSDAQIDPGEFPLNCRYFGNLTERGFGN